MWGEGGSTIRRREKEVNQINSKIENYSDYKGIVI